MTEMKLSLFSKHLNGPTNVTILLPSPAIGTDESMYTTDTELPVLWLLHCGCSDGHDWTHYSILPRLLSARKCIAVIPDGLNSDFYNHPEFGDGYAFADYFFDELMPFVQNWLPGAADAARNYLAGASMGSLGAWTLLLMHPERFGGIAPLSGIPRDYSYLESYRAMTSAEFRALASADPHQFPAGYGNPRHGMWYKEINMICKYPTVGDFLNSDENNWNRFCDAARSGLLPEKIFLTGGSEEAGLKKLIAFLEQANVSFNCRLVEGRGGHGFDFWDAFLPEMLDYFDL